MDDADTVAPIAGECMSPIDSIQVRYPRLPYLRSFRGMRRSLTSSKRCSYCDFPCHLRHYRRKRKQNAQKTEETIIPDSISKPIISSQCLRPPLNTARSQKESESETDKELSFVPLEPKSTQPNIFSLSDFLYKEIFGIHDIKATEILHQQRVQNFFTIPIYLESLMIFGLLLAFDSFLFIFTYLPIRLLCAFGSAVTYPFHSLPFRRNQLYDLMIACLFCVGVFCLWQVDMSRVYHAIRGQAMIKLYVLFTMVEIFDKLFCSLGQDVLDSLYYTAKFQPHRVSRLALDFLISCIYVVLHSLLLFVQVVTINIAINSSNSTLLTLLISNNFAELKSSVFKKFEEKNLFQLSCSDIVERLKLSLFVALILLQSRTWETLLKGGTVIAAEMIIDWLKHAFITKFNQIPPRIYSKFTTVLCHDLTGWQNSDTILDHTHNVSKRLGLLSLPLACVVIRMVCKTLFNEAKDWPMESYPRHLISTNFDTFAQLFSTLWTVFMTSLIFILSFFCLAAFKALLSLSLFIFAIQTKQIIQHHPSQ